MPTIRIRLPSSNFYGSKFNEERSSHRYSLYFQGLRPSQHPMRRLRRRDIKTISAYHNRAKQPTVRSNQCVLKQHVQRARRKKTWKKDLSLQERNQGKKVHARTRKIPRTRKILLPGTLLRRQQYESVCRLPISMAVNSMQREARIVTHCILKGCGHRSIQCVVCGEEI